MGFGASLKTHNCFFRYKDKTAKRRIIHRCLVGGMLFVFAWGAITNDILQSPNEIFAVGEVRHIRPVLEGMFHFHSLDNSTHYFHRLLLHFPIW